MTTAAEKKDIAVRKPIEQVRDLLEKAKPQIVLASTRHLTPDRLLRIAVTACQRTPALLSCDRMTLLGAVMKCAQIGLEPDGELAALVPFKGKVQLIVMYRGMIDIARRSGEVSTIFANVVHAKDAFDYKYGTDQFLHHKPSTEEDPGDPIYAYGFCRLKDGGEQFEVLPWRDVLKTREKALASKTNRADSPWTTHLEEMARKTGIRRLDKYLPHSYEFRTAAGLNEREEEGLPQDLGADIEVAADAAEEATRQRTEQLRDQYQKGGPEQPELLGGTQGREPGSDG